MSKQSLEIHGKWFKVEYFYQPEEPQTHEYPGCGESVEIESIRYSDNDDWTDFFERLDMFEEIEKMILR